MQYKGGAETGRKICFDKLVCLQPEILGLLFCQASYGVAFYSFVTKSCVLELAHFVHQQRWLSGFVKEQWLLKTCLSAEYVQQLLSK